MIDFKGKTGALALATLATVLPTVSLAANPFESTGYFDAVVFGNLNGNTGDVEGRLAVGGNLITPSGYSVGDRSPGDHSKYSLVVDGTLSAPNHWQVFNGNAAYRNGTQLPSMLPGYTIEKKTGVFDFADAKSDLVAASNALAKLKANGTGGLLYSTYTLTGTDSKLNVFNVNAADWATATDHQIHAPVGSTVLVNFTGPSITMKYGMAVDSWLTNKANKTTSILFNFADATTLNIESMEVLGSVLAPNANLTLKGGSIDGKVVLGSATQEWGGEFHNYDWQGSTPVPEPASLSVLGLGALAFIRKRKSK